MKPLHIILCLLLVAVPVAANPAPLIEEEAIFPIIFVGAFGIAFILGLVLSPEEGETAVDSNVTFEPDFWTTLFNAYYSARLERHIDRIVLRDVVLHEAAWLDADDPALGYAFPLTLGPVEAGTEIEIPLPSVPDSDEERGPYRVHVYFGVSGDEWVDRDVAYRVLHRYTGGEYDTTEVEGHHWSAPVTEEELSGSLHTVVIHTGGFFADTEGVETTGVSELYLVVGIVTDEVATFKQLADDLRREQPEGTTVVFSSP